MADGTEGFTDNIGGIPQSGQTVQFYLGSIPLGTPVNANKDALGALLYSHLPDNQAKLNSTLYRMDFEGRGQGIRDDFGRFNTNPNTPQQHQINQLTVLSNIIQLVSSFDQDKDLSNGIEINPGVHALVDEANFDFETSTSNIQEMTELSVWLKQAHDAQYISNKSTYAETLAMSWLISDLASNLTVQVLTEQFQYDETDTLIFKENYTLNDLGFVALYEEDNDGSGHTNSRSENTYNTYGHSLSYVDSVRENNVEEWTQNRSYHITYNEHSWEMTNTSVYPSETYASVYTRNDNGFITLSVSTENNVDSYQETILYQDNQATRKARKYEDLINDILTISFYDINGNEIINLRDGFNNGQSAEAQDGTAEQYRAYTFNDNNQLVTSFSYGSTDFTYNETTFEPTIITADPELAYEVTYTYNDDGQRLSYIQQTSDTCPTGYYCESHQEINTYNQGNVITTAYTTADGGQNYTQTNEYYEGTDTRKKSVTVYTNYTTTYEYNSNGLLTYREQDSVIDTDRHYQEHYEYNEQGLLGIYKYYSSLENIQSDTFKSRKHTYNSYGQPILIEWDNDQDGFYEQEYILTYQNGLLIEWVDNDIDPVTEEKTLDRRETYHFTTGNFNYALY